MLSGVVLVVEGPLLAPLSFGGARSEEASASFADADEAAVPALPLRTPHDRARTAAEFRTRNSPSRREADARAAPP
jgi:hypothetical protein